MWLPTFAMAWPRPAVGLDSGLARPADAGRVPRAGRRRLLARSGSCARTTRPDHRFFAACRAPRRRVIQSLDFGVVTCTTVTVPSLKVCCPQKTSLMVDRVQRDRKCVHPVVSILFFSVSAKLWEEEKRCIKKTYNRCSRVGVHSCSVHV
jgi:hypothetical protein